MTILDTEQALLARLLVDPSQVPLLRLESSDFAATDHARAFAAMQRLSAQGKAIDAVTLADEGVELPLLIRQRADWGDAPLDGYAAIIRREGFRRRSIGALEDAVRGATSARDEAEVVGAVQTAVSEVMEGYHGAELIPWATAMDAETVDGGGMPWGIGDLDRRIQPVRGGNVVVIAARPSVGKTLLAETIATRWATGSSSPVLFVSVEMSVPQLVERAKKRNGSLPTGVNLYFMDEPRATTALVRTQAARLKLKHGGLRAIVLDYLQILQDPGDPEHIRVGRMSRECKAIARENECPMIVLSQLNRASESREDRRPRLADLRDSGAIEQDADIVFGLYRERLSSDTMVLSVMKNRHGPVGDVVDLRLDLDHVSVMP